MSIQDGRCSGSSLALAERIQEKLERIVREKKTTAACAAVCGSEGLLAAACAGTRGFDDSPARVDDLYNVGSVSKIYVTAAVMKLVQEGRISLDEPVRRYLPDWRMADERCGEITVRMLLNHSSGIPGTNLHDHLDLEEEEELYTGKYRNTPAYWQTVKLRARPGRFSSYGNDGFDLVAEVVEAVTGKPYIRWLREHITEPAGAFSTGVGRRLAEGHVKVACRGDEPEYYNCFGAGAIHTTVPECAMFGSLFIDSRGIIGQAYLDETRRPQGATFLQGAYDAADYCLGWDSLYNRNRIPLGEGAVIKSGGTEQFTSYLLVGPACGLSLAISATNDGDAPWLEVLEDIGGEALKLLAKNREDGVEKQSAQASEPAGIKQSALLEVPGRYSGLAYGSTSVYRFSVQEETLYTETLQKGGAWQREEGLSGFQWDGKAFVKGEHDRITAEEYDGKVYYIRWGVAFCQKNAGYPSPGALWPNLAGACFTAEGGEDIFGRICLESINEENVLIFTTEHEEYPVVPLVCDSRNEKETCLISETTRDGIVFRLEQEGDRTWLCTGTDRYVREV
nr:serine hydrolase domain-containing protein [uncultured Acetatifactor sp.]